MQNATRENTTRGIYTRITTHGLEVLNYDTQNLTLGQAGVQHTGLTRGDYNNTRD